MRLKTFEDAQAYHENRAEPELTPFQRVLARLLKPYARYGDKEAAELCAKASAEVARMEPDG